MYVVDSQNTINRKISFGNELTARKKQPKQTGEVLKAGGEDRFVFSKPVALRQEEKTTTPPLEKASKGINIRRKDVNQYLDIFKDYANTSDLHNRVLYSYGDPSSMAQALRDEQKRTGKTKDEIFKGIVEKCGELFDKLKASNVVVVEGTNLSKVQILNPDRFAKIKDVYLQLVDRPETFERLDFETKERVLVTELSQGEIDEKTKDFKHIVNDILPEILKSKTIVVDDILNLKKIMHDEVIRALILDKLAQEEASKPSSGKPPIEDFEITPEQKRLKRALRTLDRIDKTFDITFVHKVPNRFYNPFNKDKKAPETYYQKSMLGMREAPKNYYEAQFLKEAAKDIKGFETRNTVIVTPKECASDIAEKLKFLNKDYLFIEEWLYKYCLGDKSAKEQMIKDLKDVTKDVSESEIRQLTKELDDYLAGYVQVFDIKKPENNAKLNEVMKDYSKITGMSELSRGYFLSVERDATKLVKLFVGIAALCEVLKKISGAYDPAYVVIFAETLVNNSQDISDACQNYLNWKDQFGDEKAKKMFEETISHILTAAVPTLMLDCVDYGSMTRNITVRNLSCVSTYAESISTFKQYYNQLENLIDKGVKKVPDEVKNDPEKLQKWKLTECWKGYAAHALNRSEAVALVVSQPFALASTLLCNVAYPLGVGGLFILFDQTFESVITNMYLLADPHSWNKFRNKLKASFVKNKKAEMTPEQYKELRRFASTKLIESKFGQKSLGLSMKVAEKTPKKLVNGIKNTYMTAYRFVNKTFGKAFAFVCMKRLDMKAKRQDEDDNELNVAKLKAPQEFTFEDFHDVK